MPKFLDSPKWYGSDGKFADMENSGGAIGGKHFGVDSQGNFGYYQNTVATVNGTANGGSFIFSPTSWGSSGQALFSKGVNNAPQWGDTIETVNGQSISAAAANKYIYAPISAGTSGQILTSTGGSPEWRNITLNGSRLGSGDGGFYAPTTSGESGNILTSGGLGGTPSWKSFTPKYMHHIVVKTVEYSSLSSPVFFCLITPDANSFANATEMVEKVGAVYGENYFPVIGSPTNKASRILVAAHWASFLSGNRLIFSTLLLDMSDIGEQAYPIELIQDFVIPLC